MPILVGVGGGLPRLAPNLTFPGDRPATDGTGQVVTGIDASSRLTTVLSLTGKYVISYIVLSALTAESNTSKLTIDGVVIWSDTYTTGTSDALFGSVETNAAGISESIQCESSFLLEYQTATDTSINLTYQVRPIL